MDFRVDRSGPSGTIFKSFVKFEFFVSKERFCIKICPSNKKFFASFLDFGQNLFGLLTRSCWARFWELQLRVHSNVFMKNIFCEKNVLFPNLLLFLTGNCLFFGGKFKAEMTKAHFKFPKEHLMENKLFEKIELTSYLRILSDLLLGFGKKLQQSCQIFTLYARGTNWGKTFVLKKKIN